MTLSEVSSKSNSHFLFSSACAYFDFNFQKWRDTGELKERKKIIKKRKTHSRFVDGGRESSSTTLLLLPTPFCCWVVVVMPPPPPAAKAPSFVLSARTVIVPSLSLFNFGVRGERSRFQKSQLSSLLEKTSLSLSVQKESAWFAITLTDELFLFLSSGDERDSSARSLLL